MPTKSTVSRLDPTPPAPNRFAAALRGRGPLAILFVLFVLAATAVAGPPVGGTLVLSWAWWTKLPWGELGFRKPKSWALVIVGGILAGAASKLLMKTIVMPLLGAPDINAHYQYLVHNRAALPGMLLTVLISAGILEEVIARGFLFERLGKFIGRSRPAIIATILITSTLFGAAHYPEQRWMGVEQAFLLALVDGAIFAATRQIWFLIIMHAAFDVVAMFIIYLGLETRLAHLLLH
jgi:membrane protease YdiL (CAAX protease family)